MSDNLRFQQFKLASKRTAHTHKYFVICVKLLLSAFWATQDEIPKLLYGIVFHQEQEFFVLGCFDSQIFNFFDFFHIRSLGEY